MIKYGESLIDKIMFGEQMINKVYYGPSLIFNTEDEGDYQIAGTTFEPNQTFSIQYPVEMYMCRIVNITSDDKGHFQWDYTMYEKEVLPSEILNLYLFIQGIGELRGGNFIKSLDLHNIEFSLEKLGGERMPNLSYGLTNLEELNVVGWNMTGTYGSDFFQYVPNLKRIYCNQAFKDWCIKNEYSTKISNTKMLTDEGTWYIVD